MEWFTETLHANWQQRFRVKQVLFHDKTAHQDLIVFESEEWGKVLALDGVVQTTTGDEFAYHEMLVHVPVLSVARPRDVLIVGGGDGGSLREAVKHDRVESVVQVEIDRGVIDFCERYLPELSQGSFHHPKTDIVIGDGAAFVAETDRRFDVIIVDSTDPIGPGEVLFETDFYRSCRRCLAPGGVLTTMSGNPGVDAGVLTLSQARKRQAGFEDVGFYRTDVPTYVGGAMCLGWASDDVSLRDDSFSGLNGRSVPAGLRYYTPEVHKAAFAAPAWLRDKTAATS
ncbi:MAG: polyamine aminopropyltransferase [Geminicoccaceae bacterium]